MAYDQQSDAAATTAHMTLDSDATLAPQVGAPPWAGESRGKEWAGQNCFAQIYNIYMYLRGVGLRYSRDFVSKNIRCALAFISVAYKY